MSKLLRQYHGQFHLEDVIRYPKLDDGRKVHF